MSGRIGSRQPCISGRDVGFPVPAATSARTAPERLRAAGRPLGRLARALVLLLLATVLLFGLLSGVAAAETFSVTRITDDNDNDFSPQVSGDRVAWWNSNDGIFTWTPGFVVGLGYSGSSLRLSGERLVWLGCDSLGSDYEVFTWTPDDQTVQLTANSSHESAPQVSGDRAVWSMSYNYFHSSDIFTWTPDAGTERLTTNGSGNHNPQVSGDRVVWSGSDGVDLEIFTWTPGGGIVQITDNGRPDSDPQVSGDRVVWESYLMGYQEIFTWTPDEGTVQRTTLNAQCYNLRVSGDRIVWEGRDSSGSDSDIFTWTPAGVVQLTSSPSEELYPEVSGERVAWEAYTGGNYEIFTWTPDGGTTQVTSNAWNDNYPLVSGDRITWEAYAEGGDTEIFTAVPDTEVDTDGDALPDAWEINGIDIGPDGEPHPCNDGDPDLDLPDMGADPYRKDVFVYIDWMKFTPGFSWSADLDEYRDKYPEFFTLKPHDVYPSRWELERVVKAFDEAPVGGYIEGPDGTTVWTEPGIHLHFEIAKEGIPAVDDLDGDNRPEFLYCLEECGGEDALRAIKDKYFDPVMESVFHYCLYAEYVTRPENGTAGAGGWEWGNVGFAISKYASTYHERYTFMHELGHALGLCHGGGKWNWVNFKPNYLSVMNYSFSSTGLFSPDPAKCGTLDYSRHELAALDNTHLYEPFGVTFEDDGRPLFPETGLGTIYWTNGERTLWFGGAIVEGPTYWRPNAVDWNWDQIVDDHALVPAAINWVPGHWDDNPYVPYCDASQNDWDNLEFDHSGVGGGAPAEEIPHTETSWEQFEAAGLNRWPYWVTVGNGAGNPVIQTYPGWRGTLPLTIENLGDLADSYTVEVTSSSSLVRMDVFPNTLLLAPGETYELNLGVEVPLDQPDGLIDDVHIVVTSQVCPNSGSECVVTIESRRATLDDSVAGLGYVLDGLGLHIEDTPLVSTELVEAAENVEAARVDLAEPPADRAAAVKDLHQAVVLLWQAIQTLAEADAQSGTPIYAVAIEDLKNYSTLLVTVAQNETEQAIIEAEAAGADAVLIAEAHARLADGNQAFAQDDHVAAVTLYASIMAPDINTFSGAMDPCQTGTPVDVVFTFADLGEAETHTFQIVWGDGTSSAGTAVDCQGTVSHTYFAAGVYTPVLTITDSSGGSDSCPLDMFLVIYDPDGGFVTGGGWIASPVGAYAPDPGLTGKATFGFVSKYVHGATIPTGNTEFQFKVADLTFKSTSYDWLVVAGAKAKYKGSGTIDGQGEYGFMISAVDEALTPSSDVDLFRIKIWDKATGVIVYDNQMGESDDADATTAIGGGSIVVHK